jgi:hypothetical protein
MGVSGAKEILSQRVLHISAALVHQRGQQKISTILDGGDGDENDP